MLLEIQGLKTRMLLMLQLLEPLLTRKRRRQLAQLGSAGGIYKTVVKYLVGVPQVLLDFVRQINDDHGPMEEQRHRYGPLMYALTTLVLSIHLFLSLSWWRFEDARFKQKHHLSILDEAVNVYISELERFLKFTGEVFANSPFFVTAEEADAIEAIKTMTIEKQVFQLEQLMRLRE